MSRRSARERRVAAVVAAKERRKKVAAFAGVAVLAVVLLIQGPKLLDAFGGGSEESVAVPPAGVVQQPKQPRPQPQFGSAVDPFAARQVVGNDPAAATIPEFGGRDPFQKGAAPSSAPAPATPAPKPAPPPATPLPNQIVIGTPKPDVVARRGWIVIMASIPTRSGRASAQRFAGQVRRNGVTSVGVLDSSTRRPLRAGYYVVYNGPYRTMRAVQRAAAHIRALGYRTAYVRPILQY